MAQVPPKVPGLGDLVDAMEGDSSNLREEIARLRKALQSISNTLDSADEDSLRMASRMAKNMATTALQMQTPLHQTAPRPAAAPPGLAMPMARPMSGAGRPPPIPLETLAPKVAKDETQPGVPRFKGDTDPKVAPVLDPTPLPTSPTPMPANRAMFIPPSAEPARRPTEPMLNAVRKPKPS